MTVSYNFNIPLESGEPLTIPLEEGGVVFVLGANGVGKSALMIKVFNDNYSQAKRILAYRHVLFSPNMPLLTASNREQQEENIKVSDSRLTSRYCDSSSSDNNIISIFDLIEYENVRARKIANFIKNDAIKEAVEESKKPSHIENINEILLSSNMLIQIILKDNGELSVEKNGTDLYNMSELSDGERNALLICADVLTAKPSQLVVIDEPERHLHRSIISPLLTTLFSKRKDCAFVISTHDVQLPIDHSDCSVVLVRNCTWENKDARYDEKSVKYWEADLISKVEDIPDDVKHSILGSKRNVLFVEGKSSSLDQQFYQLIYPELSVVHKGNCRGVIDAVKGGRGIDNLVWIDFYGLIDADDRLEEQIQKLLADNIATTKAYSVESLYYHTYIIKKVAQRCAELLGGDWQTLYARATSNILSDFEYDKKTLCARLCEKRIRDSTMSKLPKFKNIEKSQDSEEEKIFKIEVDLYEELSKEIKIADDMIASNDLDGIISRYPLRETQALSQIAKQLTKDRQTYENIVRKLTSDDPEVKNFYRSDLLKNLTDLVELKSSIT